MEVVTFLRNVRIFIHGITSHIPEADHIARMGEKRTAYRILVGGKSRRKETTGKTET
jgi:hypothetical protein